METTNKLFYSGTKFFTENEEDYRITVRISLDDDCKNNICDWSITADVDWKNKHGKYEDYLGGCCHDEVAKHFPELAKFISLHLCNHYGAPMHPVENGIYHVRRSGMSVAMEYLRISEQECVELYKASEDKISDTGNMRFVASKLESIKKSIEKYKRAKTELSYTDIWGAFGNMMDYIQFFNMGTAKSILKKSANDWLGTNHKLSKSGDSIKRKHVHELKRIFQILLDHQGLKVLGTVNVIVDEVCGEGTWIKYSERSERWRKGEEERERIKLERLRKEEEARYKDFDEKLEERESGEINFLNTPFYIPGEKPNAWIRIKGNIIETSKQIKIGIAEARKLWRAVSAMRRGAEFRHGLVEDVTGHQWSLNRYENDLLTAGCHRIAYNEMERIAKQLGWV